MFIYINIDILCILLRNNLSSGYVMNLNVILLVMLYVRGISVIIKNVGKFFVKFCKLMFLIFWIINVLIIIRIGVIVLSGMSLINGINRSEFKNKIFVISDVKFVCFLVVISDVFFIEDIVGFVLNMLFSKVEVVVVWKVWGNLLFWFIIFSWLCSKLIFLKINIIVNEKIVV